jgi:hypothetical protein
MVEWLDRRMLIDCGLFQGSREMAEENAKPVGLGGGEAQSFSADIDKPRADQIAH